MLVVFVVLQDWEEARHINYKFLIIIQLENYNSTKNKKSREKILIKESQLKVVFIFFVMIFSQSSYIYFFKLTKWRDNEKTYTFNCSPSIYYEFCIC